MEERIGQYRLLDPLGHGGIGMVYRAEDVDTGAHVALKLLGHGRESSERQRVRFEREIAAQQRPDPGVAQVFDRGESALGPWYAMELMDGPTLAAVIERPGVLRVHEAVRIVRTMAACLARLHRDGLCHRDVKPSNILLTTGGEPKLADFGLLLDQERETRLTRSHQAIAPPATCPPSSWRRTSTTGRRSTCSRWESSCTSAWGANGSARRAARASRHCRAFRPTCCGSCDAPRPSIRPTGTRP
ncbi:MAG: serine/threonine protein kinase [Proteobacteria bacterium]|nr:serine/threonine protein kinase [Pseudomonadota bacterium]